MSGFMQGRFISGNIIGTLDLIEYACIYDIPAVLIAVDFHKAFDVIKRNSLYYLLHNMSFGESFIQHIKLLYTVLGALLWILDGLGNTLTPLEAF